MRDHRTTVNVLSDVTERLAAEICNVTDVTRTDRLWPADPIVFQTNPMSLAHGAAGIALFLYRQHGKLRDDIRVSLVDLSTKSYMPPGLYTGLSGVAVCFAQMGLIEQGKELLKKAAVSPLLHRRCDLYSGLAGYGLALLQYARGSGEAEYVERASQIGAVLLKRAKLEGDCALWTEEDEGVQRVGFANGSSGIALFLLYLWQCTAQPRFLALAQGALEADIRTARRTWGYLSWPVTDGGTDFRPYWLRGGGGVVEVLGRFWKVLGTQRYLDLAREGAEGCTAFFSAGPHLFEGLASMGSTLLDLYLCCGDPMYLTAAREKAIQTLFYRIDRGHNLAFAGRFLQRISHDYGMGGAGIGVFLQRAINLDPHPIHDLPQSSVSP